MSVSLGNSPLRAPPRTFLCYVCGRAYGSASISIHAEACEKRFLAEQAALPLRERKPLPKPIDYSVIGVGGQSEEALQRSMEAINEAARAASDTLMAACAHCGRTFNPERLVIHNRSCTAEHPAKRLLSGGGTAGGAVASAEEARAAAPPLAPPQPPRSVSAGLGARRAGRAGEPATAAAAAAAAMAAALQGQGAATLAQRARALGSVTAPLPAHAAAVGGDRPLQRHPQPLPPQASGGRAPSRAWRSRLTSLAQRLQDAQASFSQQFAELADELALLAAEAGEEDTD